MTQCPFCPPDESRTILANPHALAISGNLTVSPGHTLIIPPQDRTHWPAQEYLHEDRREWKL